LFRVLSSSDSGIKKKQTALNNLQQLKPKIEKLQQRRESSEREDFASARTATTPGKRQLFAEREKFQGNQMQVDSIHQGAANDKPATPQSLQLLNPQEQQAVVQKQAQGIVAANSSGFFDNSKPTSSATPAPGRFGGKSGTIAGLGYPSGQDNQQGQRGPFGDRGKGDQKQKLPPGDRPVDLDVFVAEAGDGQAGKKMAPAARLKEGVMSLEFSFSVPENSRVLTFTKPGGGPKLQLKVRPQRTRQTAMRLLWSGTWLLLGIAMIVFVTRFGTGSALGKAAPLGAVVVGAIGACLLPMPWSLAGFTVFLIGCVAVTLRKTSTSEKRSV
jgi:hypothetical protein